jgi:hypothetical protein
MLEERVGAAMALTNELAEGLNGDALVHHIGEARSNTIGEQFWCVVGARESYSAAIGAGQWQGFGCSLADPHAPVEVRAALASSLGRVSEQLDASAPLDAPRTALLVDLLEHEAQHHGQLIRYFYANELPFPPSFAKRYALG